MYLQTINLDQALLLEGSGSITIIDAGGTSLPAIDHSNHKHWLDNYDTLRSKVRTIPSDKVMQFFSPKYRIQITQNVINKPNQFIWRYLYGLENTDVLSRISDDIEYVYILQNAGYPNLIKIGMTKGEVARRVKQINTSGTLYEWYCVYAVPVQKGFGFRIETAMHNLFADCRVSSDSGSSREFFKLDSLTAFDRLREVAAFAMVGNPIIY